MFNYNADQIFVIHPHGAGGGILSLILSLDERCASLNFKSKTVDEKLCDWQKFIAGNLDNAHLYDQTNINTRGHTAYIKNADFCEKYVHKGHFYNLDQQNEQKKLQLLNEFCKPVKSIGVYVTDSCVKNLIRIRNNKSYEYNYYSSWIYSNQTRLLKDFFDITCVHTLSFSELLNKDLAVDHIIYCKDVLDLDFDNTLAESFLTDWYNKVLRL